MRLEWILQEPETQCSEPMKPGSRIICELPWDHIILQGSEPTRMIDHMGRSKTGNWHSWG